MDDYDYLPASIRTNNPGAQWYGPTARQFGATGSQTLPGGNNAAAFDDPVNGAAAQFALWDKNYTGMPLGAAISKWSGGNSSPGYAAYIQKQTGLTPDTVITRDVLASPQGTALMKAQARWEAGRDYPLTDNQWQAAQNMALGGQQSSAPPLATRLASIYAQNPAPGTAAPSAPQGTAAGNLFSSGFPAGQSDQPGMLNNPSDDELSAQFAAIPGMLGQMQQEEPQAPPQIHYPDPPGLARARMMNMMNNPQFQLRQRLLAAIAPGGLTASS